MEQFFKAWHLSDFCLSSKMSTNNIESFEINKKDILKLSKLDYYGMLDNIKTGNLEAVNEFIKNGCDVNAREYQ